MPPWPPDAKIIARFPVSCRKRPFCEEPCPPKGGQKNFFRRQRAHVRYLFPRIRASVGAKPTVGRAERPTHHTAINTPHSAQRTASAHQHIAHHAQALAAPGSNTAGVAFIAQRAPRCVSRCYHQPGTPPHTATCKRFDESHHRSDKNILPNAILKRYCGWAGSLLRSLRARNIASF